jgi:hypothetical protein
MRQLNENTGAITGFCVAAFSSTMFHIFEHGKRIAKDRIGFGPIDVGYESDTTGIVLKLRCVQAFGGGCLHTSG